MLRQRDPRIHDERHLSNIRQLSCVVCTANNEPHNSIQTEAAHIRYADLRAGKEMSGLGQKPHDQWTVPLCGLHHRDQHDNNEREWWSTWQIDPVKLALALYLHSGDHAKCEEIIRAYLPN